MLFRIIVSIVTYCFIFIGYCLTGMIVFSLFTTMLYIISGDWKDDTLEQKIFMFFPCTLSVDVYSIPLYVKGKVKYTQVFFLNGESKV